MPQPAPFMASIVVPRDSTAVALPTADVAHHPLPVAVRHQSLKLGGLTFVAVCVAAVVLVGTAGGLSTTPAVPLSCADLPTCDSASQCNCEAFLDPSNFAGNVTECEPPSLPAQLAGFQGSPDCAAGKKTRDPP